MTARETLLRSLAPEVIDALLEFVDERMHEHDGASSAAQPHPWLTLEEAAEYLRISQRALTRAIAGKRVHSTTIGRRRLLHRNDLDTFARAATGEETARTAPPRHREE